MGFRLSLPERFYRAMVAQAQAELPNECCGLLGGTVVGGVGRVTSLYPLVNEAASPIEYRVNGYELLQKSKLMRQRGEDVLAIYHSHPTAPPVPSRKDLAEAYYGSSIYLIISLAGSEPEMRGWWLTETDYKAAEWDCPEDAAMNNPFLIGERIYLRPLEREDAPTVARWINDPEVNNTLLFQHPLSVQAEQEWIESNNSQREQITLGIVVREGERFIGVVGLKDKSERDRHVSFGIAIGDKEQWGKGYGTEATILMVDHAFRTMNLNRVMLNVLSENTRGIRAYETAGFKREGLLRQHQYRDGRYQDVIAMAILREEWKPRKL